MRPLIYDTTLRDGEQMPGVNFTPGQKVELAQDISEFGVDFIDLMPCVSKIDFNTCKQINELGLNARTTALTPIKKEFVDIAVDSGFDRILFFTSLSDLHIEKKLGMTRDENIDRCRQMLDYALSRGLVVDFAGEDTTRADREYIKQFISAIDNDTDFFFPADTMGVLTPARSKEFFSWVNSVCNCRVNVHVHNDFGLATANTLAALEGGVPAFSATFCGIGERSGNASMEEVLLSLEHLYSLDTGVFLPNTSRICRKVSKYSGVSLPSHKPVVGENAFSHESGIHTDGMIKHSKTYELYAPEKVGNKRRFLFGKYSGKNVVENVLKKHHKKFSGDDVSRLLESITVFSNANSQSFSEEEVVRLFEGMKI